MEMKFDSSSVYMHLSNIGSWVVLEGWIGVLGDPVLDS